MGGVVGVLVAVAAVSNVVTILSDTRYFVRRATTYICLHAECVLAKKRQVQLLTVPSFCRSGGVRVT